VVAVATSSEGASDGKFLVIKLDAQGNIK